MERKFINKNHECHYKLWKEISVYYLTNNSDRNEPMSIAAVKKIVMKQLIAYGEIPKDSIPPSSCFACQERDHRSDIAIDNNISLDGCELCPLKWINSEGETHENDLELNCESTDTLYERIDNPGTNLMEKSSLAEQIAELHWHSIDEIHERYERD